MTPFCVFAVPSAPHATAAVTEVELSEYVNMVNARIDEGYASLGIEAVTIRDYSLLYDFDKEEPTYISINFEPSGYAIIDRISKQLMERTPRGVSPFNSENKAVYFYSGYQSYYYKSEAVFYFLGTTDSVDEERLSELQTLATETKSIAYEKHLAELSALKSRSRGNRTKRPKYIANHAYFEGLNSAGNPTTYFNGEKDTYFGFNAGSSCSQVAAGMLLQYYDRNGIYDIVPNDLTGSTLMNKAYINDEDYHSEKYRDKYDNGSWFKTNAECLHQALRFCTFPDPNMGQYGTTISQMKDGLHAYLVLGGHSGSVSVTSADQNGMKNLIRGAVDSGHPAVMTTLVNTYEYYRKDNNSLESENIGFHTILVYGYTYDIFNNTDEYITHFGWYDNTVDGGSTNYSQVYLNSNFPATNQGALRLNFN